MQVQLLSPKRVRAVFTAYGLRIGSFYGPLHSNTRQCLRSTVKTKMLFGAISQMIHIQAKKEPGAFIKSLPDPFI
jgi:hypothetical protein